jgi:hypothetical protein
MRAPILLLLAGLCLAAPATAMVHPNCGDSLPPVPAFRLDGPVRVDGVLDEAVWQRPPSAREFMQGDPVEGAVPSESTWVWVAWDERALYLAARCWDTHPDSIITNLVRRDVLAPGDRLLLLLDPSHDHRNGYFFSLSAAGVLRDGLLSNDTWNDDSWDGVWEGRARRESGPGGCWTAEMRIPLSQLRYPTGPGRTWGINVRRRIERRAEEDYLVFQPKSATGYVSRFAHLSGIEIPHPARSLELTPYLVGKTEFLAHDPGDPFRDGARQRPGAGLDARTSVGSNLTLNVAVNPDFGQVEVDPAVVNLSDVESYFGEKRPFFTENLGMFDNFGAQGANSYWNFNWSNPPLFYTRRIGRSPQGGAPDAADFSDIPVATHILGAAKLTGTLAPGLDVGLVQAVTRREDAEYSASGVRAKTMVEPQTYYGVARVFRQFRGGFNGLGNMTTLTQRQLDGSVLEDDLNRQALVSGVDGWHCVDRSKLWVLTGWAAASRVTGTRERMIALQRSSRHYYQRPDVDYLGVDSSATSLTGHAARVWLVKTRGNVVSNSAIGYVSPGFEINDLGFLSRTDQINAHVGGGYKWTTPNRWRRYMSLVGTLFQTRDFSGAIIWEGVWASHEATYANNWTSSVSGAWNPSCVLNTRTRGGPRLRYPGNREIQLDVCTDNKNRICYELNASANGSPGVGTYCVAANPAVEWKPLSNLSVSVGPGYDHTVEDAQYVTQVDAPGEVPAGFGDRRYVFARLEQTTISANIRINVSFTPNLSLQTYLQPLFCASHYTDFKELARVGAYDFARYGAAYDPATGMVTPPGGGTPFALDDPSFNYRSLRGNAVLRWEYRPGSALYVVWTQTRSDDEARGDLEFGHSMHRLFDAHADDIFLVKATCGFDL